MTIQFRNTSFVGAAADITSVPVSGMPEIVFSGKSNVGKSSLINAIADNKKLARVSGEPGKTRMVLYFNVDNRIYLVDLPGYGYAKAPHSIQKQYSSLVDQYFAIGRPIALVLHLIDIRHQPSEQDYQMISYMQSRQMPFFIVFNKADKVSSAVARQKIDEYLSEMNIDSSVRVFCVSANNKKGTDDLRLALNEYMENIGE
jgi:GTP-binding protein